MDKKRCGFANLAYDIVEPEDGANKSLCPIIFLHSLTATKEFWQDIPEIVCNETKRKAFIIDSRDHGDSEWTDEFNFDVNVEDLFHFIDSKNLEKVILIGHSMGGYVASRFALKAPDKIQMLIIEDISCIQVSQKLLSQGLKYIEVWENALKDLPLHTSNEKLVTSVVDGVFSQIPEKKHATIGNKESLYKANFQIQHHDNGCYSLKANIPIIKKAMLNLNTFSTPTPKGVYNGPAYFIYGALSYMEVNHSEKEIRLHFPNAELISVEKASHNIHIEQPEEFLDIVLKCFSQQHKAYLWKGVSRVIDVQSRAEI